MTTRDRIGRAVLFLHITGGIVAGFALVIMAAFSHARSGNLLAGIGGIGCGIVLLRFLHRGPAALAGLPSSARR